MQKRIVLRLIWNKMIAGLFRKVIVAPGEYDLWHDNHEVAIFVRYPGCVECWIAAE